MKHAHQKARGKEMKVHMQVERKLFKVNETIFDIMQSSDGVYLIVSGEVAIYSKQGIVLARLGEGEMFGEMSIVTGDHVRKTRAVATKSTTIDKIDSSLMQKKLEESDPVLRALTRTLTYRLSDANELNESLSLQLQVFKNLSANDIQKTP